MAEGVNILLNNGAAAGQEVFHSHLHVIPRHLGDNAYQKPSHIEVTPQELVVTKDKLVAAL